MKQYRITHLLDDTSLGGVTRMLGIFDENLLGSVTVSTVNSETIGKRKLAPSFADDFIVLHAPLRWSYVPFLVSLRLRNPFARIVHVEHHYSREFERLHVGNRARFRTLLNVASKLFNAIVCVSDAQASWFREVVPTARRKVWVINPFTKNEELSSLPIPEFKDRGRVTIGAYGRFDHQKGLDTLIGTYNSGAFKGASLLVGGFGPDEGKLRKIAGQNPGIEFYGKIDDLSDFLGRCDIVAIPSRREPFGLVAFEARQAGRPILVSPADALPDQARDCGLVIDFNDAEETEAKYSSLHSRELQKMAAAARASTFGRAREIQTQWIGLLHGISQTPPCRPPKTRNMLAAPLPEPANGSYKKDGII